MKINWKLRLQNKVTLISLSIAVVTLIYQVLAIVGVTPSIAESDVKEIISTIINALCVMGIIVDPTTKGVGDSDKALGYSQPN